MGSVYTGGTKGPDDFADSDADSQPDLASKEFQIIKTYKKSGAIQIGGASKTVLTGSYLEIIAPEYAIWHEQAVDYLYVYIFTSDSAWEVDVCAAVPSGYTLAGVYDENGDPMVGTECVQTVVTDETKVVAYSLEAGDSSEPSLIADFNITHNGEQHQVSLTTPGRRDRTPGAEKHETYLPTLVR